VKIDQGFLMAVIGLFSSGEPSDEQKMLAFHKDCEAVDQTLMEDTNKSVTAVARNFYDELHCSPIKVVYTVCIIVCLSPLVSCDLYCALLQIMVWHFIYLWAR